MTALAIVLILVAGISFTLMSFSWFCLVEPIFIKRSIPAKGLDDHKSALLWAV